MSQNEYLRLRYCAIAMFVAILLLTAFVNLWCLVSAILAVGVIAISDILIKDCFSDKP